MNALLILSLFVIVAVSQPVEEGKVHEEVVTFWTQILAPHIDDCREETGVDMELVNRMIQYNEFPNDRNLGCFIKCYAAPERLNLISHSGEAREESLHKILGVPADVLNIDHCRLQKTDDLCETALLKTKCAYEVVAKLQAERL